MPVHVLRIIREISDRGGYGNRKCAYFCSEMEAPAGSWWKPNTDIFESDEQVRIRIELAGVPRENVCIELKGGKLVVSGIRPEKRPDARIYYHQLELNYGQFMRVISLPESVEHNDIAATLEDGVLEVIISKNDRAIEIPIMGIDPVE
jgi:HSP20 family protein